MDSERLDVVIRELRQVEEKQRRLARLYVEGTLPEDILSTQSEELNRRRLQLESERRELKSSAPHTINVDDLQKSLPEAANRLRQWVLAASENEMELILRALDIQIRASHEQVHIEGTVPVSLPQEEGLVTIERTSA